MSARTERRQRFLPTVIVAVVFGLLFAIDIWQAADNLLHLPAVYDAVAEASGIPLATPWFWLVVGVALPPLLYGGAFVVARRRPAWQLALALLAAWAVTAATSLSIETILF